MKVAVVSNLAFTAPLLSRASAQRQQSAFAKARAACRECQGYTVRW